MLRKILAVLLAAAAVSGCSETSEQTIRTLTLSDTAITRGQAVKMLALSRYTLDEINSLPRETDLSDSSIDNWCDKYINAAVKAGIINGTQENTFMQDEMLTLEQAGFILKNAAPDKNLVLQYDTADRKKPIGSKVWFQAYDAIKNDVSEKETVLLADSRTCSELKDGYVLSSDGLLNAEGINIDESFFCRGIKAYIKDNCILALKEVTTDEPVINSAVVYETADDGAVFDIKGCRMFFYSTEPLENGETVNIKINGNRIIEILK